MVMHGALSSQPSGRLALLFALALLVPVTGCWFLFAPPADTTYDGTWDLVIDPNSSNASALPLTILNGQPTLLGVGTSDTASLTANPDGTVAIMIATHLPDVGDGVGFTLMLNGTLSGNTITGTATVGTTSLPFTMTRR